ncbi:MAG TPA: ABC transporter ATP-binding protein, partial [Gammaproteobacteria bacterium]|nr:ABC transporter ATP-binding protein [Gammaproteobacteria bacterium]
IKIMLGLVKPDAGEVFIMGRPARGEGFRDVRRNIGYLPENIIFYPNLSGLETMQFFAGLKGADPKTCFTLLEKAGLGNAVRRPVRAYSRGMCQRLGFAQALLGKPRILFLDEPTAGLDPGGVRGFYDMLAELKLDGVTVILSSHNLAEIQNRVDRLALVRLGNLQAAGTVQDLHDALTLPVQVRLRLSAGGDISVRTSLSGVPGCSLKLDGTGGTIECSQAHKMQVLATLMSLPEVVDVHVREPSLEDVYLGYAENPNNENSHAQN